MLKFGYKASAEQFDPRRLLEFGVLAEQAGFDSVWVSDHFQPWRHTDGHAPFSLAWMGALGERTSRIVMGTSVLTPTFRYQPAVVAQAMGTLALLSPGRVVLGVGTGESLNETPVTDMEWPAGKERLGRLRESIDLMRQLWDHDFVSFQGNYYRTRNATVYDRPPGGVPIYIAAAGPQAARFAGRLGDGFICTSGKGMDLYQNVLLPGVEEGARSVNRDPATLDYMIEIKVSFDTEMERALQDTRHWAALALSPEEKTGVEDPREMERRAAALPIDRVASRWIVSSDPAEHVERILPYIQCGFRHLVFHAPGPDQARFLELYARDVLPRLRKIG